MSKFGTMSFENFGYSMPVSESLFARPPFRHHGVDAVSVTFETSYDMASKIVPIEVEFAEETPLATLLIQSFKNAAIPNYLEAILMLHCKFKGKGFMFMPSILVTSPGPMVTGREIWGYPKKPAVITLDRVENNIVAVLKRPNGAAILTVTAKSKERLSPDTSDSPDGLFLKLIPSAEHKAPEVCQLVGAASLLTPAIVDGEADVWRANANIVVGEQYTNDPWSAVPVCRIISAKCGSFDTFLSYGYIVHDYMK